MNRRSLLRTAAGALAAHALPSGLLLPASARAQACSARASGVQLYTVRDLLARDARGTLATLAGLGLAQVEAFGLDAITDGRLFGLPLATLTTTLGDLGLTAPTSNIGGALASNAAAADAANALGIGTLIVALPTELSGERGMVAAQSIEQLDRLAER